MSEVIIKNASNGSNAVVDNQGRLHVEAVTKREIEHLIEVGRVFNAGTGYITLTTDTASDLLYFKNTSSDAYEIDLYVINARASTGGSGDLDVEVLRNPTGGTLVSTATEISPVNMSFSSNLSLGGELYKGFEGATLTGNDNSFRSKTTADNRLLLGIVTQLEQGSSVGVRVTPPTGNTSMEVEVVIEIFKRENV